MKIYPFIYWKYKLHVVFENIAGQPSPLPDQMLYCLSEKTNIYILTNTHFLNKDHLNLISIIQLKRRLSKIWKYNKLHLIYFFSFEFFLRLPASIDQNYLNVGENIYKPLKINIFNSKFKYVTNFLQNMYPIMVKVTGTYSIV